HRRGLSNVLMMTALGGGSIAGPVAGRVLVQWQSGVSSPGPSHFDFAFAAFVAVSLVGALLMLGFGEYPHASAGGRRAARAAADRQTGSLRRSLELFRFPKYVLLVISLGLLGGPVFQ